MILTEQLMLMKHFNFTWQDVQDMPTFERDFFVTKLREYLDAIEEQKRLAEAKSK